MSDAPHEPGPPPPDDKPMAGGLSWGLSTGLMIGLVLVVLFPIAGAAIDGWLHRGEELAGLGGLFLGAILGVAALLIATIAAFVAGARRHKPWLHGVARGLLLVIALIGLTAGFCAVI